MRILKNDYTITAYQSEDQNKNGSVLLTGEKWEKQGLVGNSVGLSVNGFNKKPGDEVEEKDFKVTGAGETMISQAGDGNGTTFFLVALGGEFHAAFIALTTTTNPITNVKTHTFSFIDQVKGFEDKGDAGKINAYLG